MNVGLDLSFLEPHSGGSGTYARELIAAIRSVAPDTRLTAWVSRDAPALDVECVRLPFPATGSPLRLAAQLSWIGLDARRRGIDVVHGLAYAAPVIAPGVATVVTIHDLTWRHQPEAATPLARRMFGLLSPLCGTTADRVIAVSQHAKDDLVSTLGLDAAKIDVVHHGVSDPPHFTKGSVPFVKRYVLSVGQITPHKNLEVLIDAGLEAAVVLVGKPSEYSQRLADRATQRGVDIVLTGFVDDATLEGLYAGAAAFVLPSLHEGFGLPIVEAMQRGVPVACSDASALPEIAGGAARLFDPHSAQSVAEAVRELLDDPEPWIARGRARAAELTWERTAEATLDVYRRALDARVVP